VRYPPRDFTSSVRLHIRAELLRGTDNPVAEIVPNTQPPSLAHLRSLARWLFGPSSGSSRDASARVARRAESLPPSQVISFYLLALRVRANLRNEHLCPSSFTSFWLFSPGRIRLSGAESRCPRSTRSVTCMSLSKTRRVAGLPTKRRRPIRKRWMKRGRVSFTRVQSSSWRHGVQKRISAPAANSTC
jgi:hypothetical protein